MITSNSQSPQKSRIVIGANILTILRDYPFESVNPLIIMGEYNEKYNEISFSYLMFGLDWLFLIDTLRLTESGDVQLCN